MENPESTQTTEQVSQKTDQVSQTTEQASQKTVSAELSSEQYAFLTQWQKSHEKELGIEVPLGSMVRKAVDIAMKSERSAKEERPPREDRPPRPFGDKPPFRKSFGGRSDGPRRDAPRYSALGSRNKKTF